MQTEHDISVYLSGCYGDFDSFEFLPTDAAKIRSMAEGLRVG